MKQPKSSFKVTKNRTNPEGLQRRKQMVPDEDPVFMVSLRSSSSEIRLFRVTKLIILSCILSK